MVHQEPPATFTISFPMPCGFLNFFFFFCFLQCTACNLASKKPQQTMWCSVDVTIWQHENRNVYFSQQCSCALTAQSAKPHVCVWIRVFCSFWIRDFSATTDENIIGNHLGSSLSVGIIRERRKKTTTTISGAHMVNPQPPLYWWCLSFNLSAWKSPLRLRCMVHLSAVVRENFLRFFSMTRFDTKAPFGDGPRAPAGDLHWMEPGHFSSGGFDVSHFSSAGGSTEETKHTEHSRELCIWWTVSCDAVTSWCCNQRALVPDATCKTTSPCSSLWVRTET